MKRAVLFLVIFAVGCASNSSPSKVADKCPVDVLDKRALEAQSSEIAVVGTWQSLESILVPDAGVSVGNIAVSKTLRGTLEPNVMVGIVTGDISDSRGKIVQCGLKAPTSNQTLIFYISRGAKTLQVIDYRPNSES